MSVSVIIAPPNDELLKKLNTLNIMLDTHFLIKESYSSVLDLLQHLSSIKVIITRLKINGENARDQLVNYLEKSELQIPVLVIGGDKVELMASYPYLQIPPFSNDQELLTAVAELLGITNLKDFYPLPTQTATSTVPSPTATLSEKLDIDIVNKLQNDVKTLFNIVGVSQRLSQFLARLFQKKSSYQFRHNYLCAYYCALTQRELSWITSEQSDQLMFVSFFHNMLLQTEEQIKIHSENGLIKSTLSLTDRELVKAHALECSEIIRNTPGILPGVATIILHHHGSTTGMGFPGFMNPNLTPLAFVFMICERLASLRLLDSGRSSLETLTTLSQEHEHPKYQEAISALYNSLNKNLIKRAS